MALFDDLIPAAQDKSISFDDLIPVKAAPATDAVTATVPSSAPAAPATAPEVDLTKPSFGMSRAFRKDDVAKKVQAEATAEREAPKITYDEMSSNPDIFKIITDYSKVGMKTEYKEGADKKEFVNSFMANMRGEEWNTFSNVAALNKILNSPLADQEKLALGNKLYEKIASAGGKGGQPGLAPYTDIAKALLTDPVNYAGGIVAGGLKKAAASSATKAVTRAALGEVGEAAAKSKIASLLTPVGASLIKPAGIVAAATATDAAVGVGQNVAQQKMKQQVSKAMQDDVPELDAAQMGLAALFGAAGGFIEAKGVLAAPTGKSGAQQFSEKIASAKVVKDPAAPVTDFERLIADPITKNMDDVVSEFNKQEGRRVLGEIDPATALTDAKVQSDLSARAVRVAMRVIEVDPTFRVKPNQKTSDAISEVFSNLDKIDDVTLEAAIRKEGLSPEQFAQANLMTVSDAARVMQQYSAASKVLTRMTQIDPEINKLVESLFNKPDEYVSALGRVGQVVRTVERESKAFIVSGIGTTVRNVLGTATALTYNSAASLVEGALYTVGRTLDGAASGNRLETAKNALGDTFRDAFSVYGYLAKNGLANEVTNTLLEHNPALRNNILGATQESSLNKLSKVAQVFNTLNVAQDSFFRKAIFSAAVEKHMRRAGLDMYQVIGEGKAIPSSILQQASDETLKATFSYSPKVQKKGIETFEAGAEATGNLLIKAAELPGGSLLATFPRFMTNAIAFQYRYSVFGLASGAEDLLRGSLMKAAGSSTGDGLIRKGQENIAKGVVGTAALAAAYDYRLNNQETDWYNMKKDDGGTVDTRALFPLGPTLAVADFLAKRKLGLEPKTAEMAEAILGMKMPAGTQNQLLDQIFSAMSSEKDADKLEITIGKTIGDFTARFTQPFIFKSAYEFFDLFREEGSVQRDPNVITGNVMGVPVPALVEAGANRVQAKLPILKEGLPEAIPRLREGPVYKEGEFFYSLIGVREAPAKNPSESEVSRLGIDPYRLYGPSSGDKTYDRAFVEAANPYVMATIERALSKERYQQLSPTEQKEALTNAVRDSVEIARTMTDAKFSSNDITRVKKMQFNKLTSDQRKIINERYAKDNDGVTLEEADDYKQIDRYKASLGNLQFAVGGLASVKAAAKLMGKAAKSLTPTQDFLTKAKSLKASAQSVDTAAVDDILNKYLPPSSAAEQTTSAIPSIKKAAPTPAPAEAPVVEAPMASKIEPEAPVARQMEQMTATPTEVVPEAPMLKQADEAMPADGGFTSEQYAAGEKAMAENYEPEFLKSWKIANYDDYMSTAHSYTGQAAGMKWNETPPNPFLKQSDDSAASLLDETPFADDVYASSEPASLMSPRMSDEKAEKILSGDLNNIVKPTSASQRDGIIAEIKNKREDSFLKLRNDRDFAAFDDDVIGVMLGEYRAKTGFELTPKGGSDQMANAQAMAEKLQVKFDQLQEKYKAVPAMRLYHGGKPDNIESLKKTGFFDPAKYTGEHSEMHVGAPSFTKDLNLGFSASSFGGRSPDNYLYTDIPYANYQFSRINMRPENYDIKDMNTIVRAITGAPDVVRPISLPRAGFSETEDMMLEANKLRVKGKNATLKPVSTADTYSNERFNQASTGIKTKAELTEDRTVVNDAMKQAVGSRDKKESVRFAYQSYTALRDLMNEYMNMSKGAIGAGTGQQYQAAIDQMIDYGGIVKQLPDIADILANAGATQKADNLRKLRDALTGFSRSDPGFGSSAVSESKRKDSLQRVREMTPKLAKGGLASRRK